MEIYYSPVFRRQYRALPLTIKLRAEKAEKLFRRDPFSPQLKTHKLGGHFKNYWTFSVDFHYRIIFEFYKKNMVRFHLVGDHSIYK